MRGRLGALSNETDFSILKKKVALAIRTHLHYLFWPRPIYPIKKKFGSIISILDTLSFTVLKIMFPMSFQSLDLNKCFSIPLSNTRTSSPFVLLHSDIWGLSRIANASGARWFVSYIDDCTRVTWIFLLKPKKKKEKKWYEYCIPHLLFQGKTSIRCVYKKIEDWQWERVL